LTPAFLGKLREALEMIKFSHSVFALPFALLSAVRAAGTSGVGARTLFWIVAAMVAARTAAMTFNRIADLKIDGENPRTSGRALPSGRLSIFFAAGLCAVSAAVFVFAARELNPLAFALSVPTLCVLFLYSLSKRFTALSHVLLGLSLGIAPMGAWVAVTGKLARPPLFLCLAVLCWTAGFDVLYSLQDEEFDRARGLHSLPARLGARRALRAARLFHAGTIVFFVLFASAVSGGLLLWGAVALSGAALCIEHALVKAKDLSRLGAAFFTVNGFLSVGFGVLGIADVWLPLRW
jgi:4-hydroxybenzoate polyprenyltransferase